MFTSCYHFAVMVISRHFPCVLAMNIRRRKQLVVVTATEGCQFLLILTNWTLLAAFRHATLTVTEMTSVLCLHTNHETGLYPTTVNDSQPTLSTAASDVNVFRCVPGRSGPYWKHACAASPKGQTQAANRHFVSLARVWRSWDRIN